MIQSLLVANRGEIAVRIMRTCKELGIRTVAVYSEPDSTSLHVRMADTAVCIGPASAKDSYLNIPNIVTAATLNGCNAVHPGVGFLAENAGFARTVIKAGLIFVGPDPDVIDLLGDKINAKHSAVSNGLPVIPGSKGPVRSAEEALAEAREIGFPVIIKAAAGGGGKGMRIVRDAAELPAALGIAASEAKKAFSDDSVYLEKFIEEPRHVEIQLIADGFGTVVSLGERDCTVQKSHQKLLEESPSPALSPELRTRMAEDAIRLFRALGYSGAGTVEFLVKDDAHYFMEVNARVQVEHPVSELVSGVDIIEAQLRAASGERLPFSQAQLPLSGYALECRINALGPGVVSRYDAPGGRNVRVDSFLHSGCMVSPYYDALLAKIIVFARDRREGIARMLRALDETVIEGVPTNLAMQRGIVGHELFRSGRFGTGIYERLEKEIRA
ncbi:MAG TPA: biotin carboxylase N-terminal domain-containing protein [Rectinemataceae bacterium]|nr:biotin carboxylase N-terminal domain-containing protein [Rectinemataceae bacterium]